VRQRGCCTLRLSRQQGSCELGLFQLSLPLGGGLPAGERSFQLALDEQLGRSYFPEEVTWLLFLAVVGSQEREVTQDTGDRFPPLLGTMSYHTLIPSIHELFLI